MGDSEQRVSIFNSTRKQSSDDDASLREKMDNLDPIQLYMWQLAVSKIQSIRRKILSKFIVIDYNMISNKFLQLDPPINIKQNINNVLFGKKKYSSQKIEDNITTRNVNDDVLSNNNSDDFFNRVMDDFEAPTGIPDETTDDLFIDLLLSRVNYNGSAEDENIDTLLQNIKAEITNINNEIKEIRIATNVYLSSVPSSYEFNPDDAKLIENINGFLEKYKDTNL